MVDRLRQPAYALHALVHLLDRAAEEVLAERVGIPYKRYLTLLTVERLADAGPVTQRELAAELGVSEPAASRTVAILRDLGWLSVTATPGAGNRRRLGLTDTGQKLVDEAATHLERAFGRLLRSVDLGPRDVLAVTDLLLRRLVEETRS